MALFRPDEPKSPDLPIHQPFPSWYARHGPNRNRPRHRLPIPPAPYFAARFSSHGEPSYRAKAGDRGSAAPVPRASRRPNRIPEQFAPGLCDISRPPVEGIPQAPRPGTAKCRGPSPVDPTDFNLPVPLKVEEGANCGVQERKVQVPRRVDESSDTAWRLAEVVSEVGGSCKPWQWIAASLMMGAAGYAAGCVRGSNNREEPLSNTEHAYLRD